MFVDFIHNTSILEKMRFFAWLIFALYMLFDLTHDAFNFRNYNLSSTTCEDAGGVKTQMFVVLEGRIVFICLKNPH